MGSQTEYPCLYLHSHTSSFLQGVSFWIYPLNTYVHLCDEADTKYTSLMLCISYGWKTPNHVYSSASVYYWNICLKWLHSSLYKMLGFIPRVKSLSHISLSHFKKKRCEFLYRMQCYIDAENTQRHIHNHGHTQTDSHKYTQIHTDATHIRMHMKHTIHTVFELYLVWFNLTVMWCQNPLC